MAQRAGGLLNAHFVKAVVYDSVDETKKNRKQTNVKVTDGSMIRPTEEKEETDPSPRCATSAGVAAGLLYQDSCVWVQAVVCRYVWTTRRERGKKASEKKILINFN